MVSLEIRVKLFMKCHFVDLFSCCFTFRLNIENCVTQPWNSWMGRTDLLKAFSYRQGNLSSSYPHSCSHSQNCCKMFISECFNYFIHSVGPKEQSFSAWFVSQAGFSFCPAPKPLNLRISASHLSMPRWSKNLMDKINGLNGNISWINKAARVSYCINT